MAKKTEKMEDGMKIVNEHIKSETFAKVYLFMGDEQYLIKQYVQKLSAALTDTSAGSLNYIRLKSDNIKPDDVKTSAWDVPFFADRKVVEVWNSGYFAKTKDDSDKEDAKEGAKTDKVTELVTGIIDDLPESTVLIFVEDNVDKRTKLYKKIVSDGRVINIDTPDETTILSWIKSKFVQESYRIDDVACYAILGAAGTDMNLISMEIEKLISYCADSKYVDKNAVDKLCTNHIENKVFDMIDALSNNDKKTTIRLYNDLIELREPSMRILYLIVRQYKILIHVSMAMKEDYNTGKIASLVGVPAFAVKKYTALCQKYSYEKLKNMLEMCVEVDANIKTGRMRDNMALDNLIFKLLGQ